MLDVGLVALSAQEVIVDACAFCGVVFPMSRVVTLRAHDGGRSDDLVGALAVCEVHAEGAARLLARALAVRAPTVAERVELSGRTDT